MKNSLQTPYGTVTPGTTIRIESVLCTMTPNPAFPDGIDHQARELNGKTGQVTFIDDTGALHGTWGGLSLFPEHDRITIL